MLLFQGAFDCIDLMKNSIVLHDNIFEIDSFNECCLSISLSSAFVFQYTT